MGKEISAGVSVSADRAQVAVLEIKRGIIKVRHLEERSRADSGGNWFFEPFVERQPRVIRKVSKVSLALDNTSVFVHLFPMDSTLTQAEQNEHVQWELSNYLRDYSAKEYLHDSHVLQTHARGQYSDVMVVVVKRSVIDNLQQTLADAKFDLYKVDTIHFGGQYALLTNYPEVRTKTVAILTVDPNRIDVGILTNGRLVKYRYFPIQSDDAIVACLEEFLSGSTIAEFFLHGTSLNGGLPARLEEKFSVLVFLLNPFRRLRISRWFKDFDAIVGQEHRFAAAVGCALLK